MSLQVAQRVAEPGRPSVLLCRWGRCPRLGSCRGAPLALRVQHHRALAGVLPVGRSHFIFPCEKAHLRLVPGSRSEHVGVQVPALQAGTGAGRPVCRGSGGVASLWSVVTPTSDESFLDASGKADKAESCSGKQTSQSQHLSLPSPHLFVDVVSSAPDTWVLQKCALPPRSHGCSGTVSGGLFSQHPLPLRHRKPTSGRGQEVRKATCSHALALLVNLTAGVFVPLAACRARGLWPAGGG